MRIGIVGAGVSGQAAAIALTRAGHAVEVFERFETARPVGAGLLLQPSGLEALARLDLREEAKRWGARVSELDGRIAGSKRVLDLAYRKGEYGLGIHRAALFDILHTAMLASGTRLHLGFDAAAIENPERPSILSRSGQREGPYDLVLDCAGAHDTLRDTLNVGARAPLYPWGALWTTCPDWDGAFAGKLRQRYERARIMIGILPVGRLPSASDVPCVAFFWSLRLQDFEAEKEAGLEALKTRVLTHWPEAEPIVREIARFDDLTLATYRDVSVKRGRRGRIVVMGDAAHGTSPQLGQGANLALIDAITLAHHLKGTADLDTALDNYVRARRAHVAFYRHASRALTPAFQSDSRLVPWLRDTFLPYANLLPGGRHMTRTTLSGMRKLPWGSWKLPD
jgi:2-polyprenyl-6-methoxyphenol hydroxylase-like FAD-dependent oxidoreductase